MTALPLVSVRKYGGTSVGSLERIGRVADHCARAVARGQQVVAVVSAMSGETNRLLGLAQQLAEVPHARELDVLAATGEQASAALLAIALRARGVPAESFLAHQLPIATDASFLDARIRHLDASRVRAALAEGRVAVVAGFQGVAPDGSVTTLGRGGTDTTALAIAAALGAPSCEVFKDLEGVYTADPNVVEGARKLDRVSYEEMLELSALGAKVLHHRAVALALRHDIAIHVRSSLVDKVGTWVSRQGGPTVPVRGIVCQRNESVVGVSGIVGEALAQDLFEPLQQAGIAVNLVMHDVEREAATDLVVARADLTRHRAVFDAIGRRSRGGLRLLEDVARVSVVGAGMRDTCGVAATAYRVLAQTGVPLLGVATSDITLTFVLPGTHAELATRALHAGFGLGESAEDVARPEDEPVPSSS